MNVPDLEKSIGIEVYGTDAEGIGGKIRDKPDHFIVSEVLVDGTKASVRGENPSSVLGSSDSISPYLLCVLIKKGWDTIGAVKAIADRLKIGAERVQIGGMKDANAVTAQHITIKGIGPRDVQKINVKNLVIRPIGYVRNEMSSYFLFGNCFQITTAAIERLSGALEHQIERIIGQITMLGGVPNFFGHQRFGTTRPLTHLIGKAVVEGRFRDAVMLLLTEPSSYEHPQSAETRKRLQESEDFKRALNEFPIQLRYERLILGHLAKKEEDFLGAFVRLPARLQMLFVQAFQSFLFNRFLSERLKREIGLCEAFDGDYIVKVEKRGLPLIQTAKKVRDVNLGEVNRRLKEGRLRLALPLVGFKQQLSSGLQGEIERKTLSDEGTEPNSFRVSEIPEIGSRGSLRTMITPLIEFNYRTIGDVDKMPISLSTDFLLQKGSYATVFLRELMKPKDLVAAGF